MALAAILLVFGVNTAMAGGNHYHGPIPEAYASKIAQNVIHNMAQRGELSSSWSGLSPVSVKKANLDQNVVWRAVFSNGQETEVNKQNLNVYLTLTGRFIKANYVTQ